MSAEIEASSFGEIHEKMGGREYIISGLDNYRADWEAMGATCFEGAIFRDDCERQILARPRSLRERFWDWFDRRFRGLDS